MTHLRSGVRVAGMRKLRVEPTTYTLTYFDEDETHHGGMWDIEVVQRSPGKWAVKHRLGHCLNDEGEWDYEPLPSSRTEEWLEAHRFSFGKAMDLARGVMPQITVNGKRAEDV